MLPVVSTREYGPRSPSWSTQDHRCFFGQVLGHAVFRELVSEEEQGTQAEGRIKTEIKKNNQNKKKLKRVLCSLKSQLWFSESFWRWLVEFKSIRKSELKWKSRWIQLKRNLPNVKVIKSSELTVFPEMELPQEFLKPYHSMTHYYWHWIMTWTKWCLQKHIKIQIRDYKHICLQGPGG